jgi:hypothetical protein
MHGFSISVLQRTPNGRVKIGLSREGLTGGSEDGEEMKTLIKLPKYEKWASYQQWFPLNIEGMYRHVQLHRLQNP